MPKQKGTPRQMFEKIQRIHPGVFRYSNESEIYCTLCSCIVQYRNRIFSVEQHCNTNKHKLSVEKFKPQLEDENAGADIMEYDFDLSRCFLEAQIPLSKMEHASVSKFLNKYTKHPQPNLATLQLRIPKLYKETMKKIQSLVQDEFIWTSIDYITDADGRLIVNFIFGILDPNGVGRRRSYLLNMMPVESADDISSISVFFIDSLTLLWPQGIQYDKVLLCLTATTDWATTEAISTLKKLFRKMLHINCFAQCFHQIAEIVRRRFSNVNDLISNTNTSLLMAPLHRYLYKQMYPKLPLPPLPSVGRWCTWLKAAIFYADHYDEVKSVVLKLDDDIAESIIEAKKLFHKKEIQVDLNCLKRDFAVLVRGTERLEQKGLNLPEIIRVFDNVISSLTTNSNKEYLTKLRMLLQKNDGYSCLLEIHKVLYDEIEPQQAYVKSLNAEELAAFKFCPVSAYYAENQFPLYSQLFNSPIRMLKIESLKQNLIIYCNDFKD